ncbi:hypothetical protein [Nitrosovibrio tenuis]|uniref:Uncharacterized protein n=1 Tax=Nitrosovibrio tenuis TaxID=1233 RepID=A0A1H7KY88_9PROT|nr:hypothetical protein [Nitrosovibrio tenuis]SEK91739.1 hypothetical protein SAMN05216387_103378 [Nitrosovibrio tenuis]
MAIGWMTALKIIPWGNVLESAPHIVKAAKHLFSTIKTDSDSFGAGSSAPGGDDFVNLNRRIRVMEARIAELREEQKSSAELIKSLAEQNAFVVEAIEVFRARLKILVIICIMLFGVLAGLVLWLATK